MQNAVLVALCLLLIGFVCRVRGRILQRLYIPASIIGGLLGLAVVQCATHITVPGTSDWIATAQKWLATDLPATMKSWPGWLIAVVFGAMFLERESRPLSQSLTRAGREGLVVWIIVLGQTALGLLATWLIIQPFFSVNNSFGMLIETGFAGGHGTAAAMGEIVSKEPIAWSEGADLGIFMATVGLVFSVVSGMVFVNLGVRRGWTRAGDVAIPTISGLEVDRPGEAVGRATVRSEVIDPVVFQATILGLAFVVGLGLHAAVNGAEAAVRTWIDGKAPDSTLTESFPLFIYTLVGGLIVRRTMDALGMGSLIDARSIRTLSSGAMELLVIAAITSLNLEAVVDVIGPLSILILVAFVWTGICLVGISRQLLPSAYWFELGLINYGMSTGTTATGFVLLRIVDKDLDSGAAEDFALAAPLSAPFIGGGMITFMMPHVLANRPLPQVALTFAAITVALYIGGLLWARRSNRTA